MLPWGLSCRTVGTEAQLAQRHCVAYSAVLRQRTVHQNDSKFPDASLTLAKNPPPKLWSLALFSPNPSSLPFPSLSTPTSPSPSPPSIDSASSHSANQSLTLKSPSTARLSPPVRAKAVNEHPNQHHHLQLHLTRSINQSINPSISRLITRQHIVVAPPSKTPSTNNPTHYPIEIPHGGILQWRP